MICCMRDVSELCVCVGGLWGVRQMWVQCIVVWGCECVECSRFCVCMCDRTEIVTGDGDGDIPTPKPIDGAAGSGTLAL